MYVNILFMRNDPFVIGEYYHIYNRGTDKRIIFKGYFDLLRFLQSMREFNTIEPIGSIWENKYKDRLGTPSTKSEGLVDFVCYCLNPNHYHFILTPLVEGGIEKFIQKLAGGFTRYFNEKYKRSGVLFQGKFKSIHISSDEYLMYLSAYINLNNKIHRLGTRSTKSVDKRGEGEKLFWKSSWEEYMGENKEKFCNKNIVLDRYKNIEDYGKFAKSVVNGVLTKRYQDDLSFDKDLLIEKIK